MNDVLSQEEIDDLLSSVCREKAREVYDLDSQLADLDHAIAVLSKELEESRAVISLDELKLMRRQRIAMRCHADILEKRLELHND